MAIIAGLGLFVSMDFYRGYAFRAERSKAVSILEKARSKALNNINQSPHGVKFESGHYILFQGPSSASASVSENISIQGSVVFSGLSEIAFEQLSGTPNATGSITLSDIGKNTTIYINSEGGIEW